MNPNGKVPAISDNGFNLSESHTILRYLAISKNCADHWYPADPKNRAKVDEYLDWHHNNIRLGAGGYFFRKYVSGLTGKPAPDSMISESYDYIHRSLLFIEKFWFSHKSKFMFGEMMTIADLSLACELATLFQIDYDLKAFPNTKFWL